MSAFNFATDALRNSDIRRGGNAPRWVAALVLIAGAMPFGHAARADALQDYAKECDAAIGATVQDFNCDAGTEVPVTHFSGGKCDRPNRLNQVCDPGSHFQVLTNNANAYVVGHCRKKGNAAGQYGDIAVIQYGRKNGATCFYQALGSGLPGHVAAPSKGQGAWPWISPSGTAGIACAGCHDNGPFIRSPYLAQVTGPNALPGASDFSFNSNQPYAFVGHDFANWKAYKVEVAGNECISCHRLGVNKVSPGRGTALDFGIRATSASEPSKNPPSADSPIWMPPVPVQVAFNQAHANAAKAIHDCAARLNENPLPNTATCRITQFAGAYVSPAQPHFAAIWVKPGGPAFVARHGLTSAQYQQQFDQLVGQQHYCLTDVSGYESGGQALYAAIWQKTNCPSFVARHGLTAQQYQQQFDQLVGQQGYRLKLVNGYTVGGQDRYAAIWEKSRGPAFVARHGMTAQQYQQQFDDLVGRQGYCLTDVSGYGDARQARFAAIWEKKSCPQFVARHGLTAQQYQQQFDQLVGQQGYRLKLVDGYNIGGQDFYAAIWEKSPGPAFVARHGLTAQEYQQQFDDLVGQKGYGLIWVNAY